MKSHWEYKIVDGDFQDNLNELGWEGWELVSVVLRDGLPVAYLKRRTWQGPVIK